jgi:hypothetical protein
VPVRLGTPSDVRASDSVVAPVPPLATARVPVRVIVPLAVIGPPVVVRPVVPPDTEMLETVPLIEFQDVPLL